MLKLLSDKSNDAVQGIIAVPKRACSLDGLSAIRDFNSIDLTYR
jgi:hypothetical protein